MHSARTAGRTDRRTDGQTDKQTDKKTDILFYFPAGASVGAPTLSTLRSSKGHELGLRSLFGMMHAYEGFILAKGARHQTRTNEKSPNPTNPKTQNSPPEQPRPNHTQTHPPQQRKQQPAPQTTRTKSTRNGTIDIEKRTIQYVQVGRHEPASASADRTPPGCRTRKGRHTKLPAQDCSTITPSRAVR